MKIVASITDENNWNKNIRCIHNVFNNNGNNEITRDNRKTIIFGVLNYKKPSF